MPVNKRESHWDSLLFIITRRAIRGSKASVPKAKTVRWTVFSESVAETLNCEYAAASECEVLALNKHTDGAPETPC